jgi:hypothetical protein
MNANLGEELNVDLRLRKTSESSATNTLDEGTESDDSVPLNCDIGSNFNSYTSSSSHTVTKLPNTFYSLPRQGLSNTDMRVINEFSLTIERLKKRMTQEDAMALESSMLSINRIVQVGGSSNRGSESGRNSGTDV